MNRWSNIDDTPFKPHIVADSAFGSPQLLNEIEQWGGTGTFACSSTHSSWLWELLTKNVPPNHWRASIQDNLIASAHIIADPNGKFVHQKVISNGFNSTAIISDSDHLGILFILIFYQN